MRSLTSKMEIVICDIDVTLEKEAIYFALDSFLNKWGSLLAYGDFEQGLSLHIHKTQTEGINPRHYACLLWNSVKNQRLSAGRIHGVRSLIYQI